MSNLKDYILIGEVLRTNGLKGEVIVKLKNNSLAIVPEKVFIEINSKNEIVMLSYDVEYIKEKNSLEVILKIREFNDAMQASFLKSEKIFVNKDDLLVSGIETLLQAK